MRLVSITFKEILHEQRHRGSTGLKEHVLD